MDAAAPDNIGRFVRLREIGEGAHGLVFEALDEVTGDNVALKELRAEVAHDPKLIRRFASEAEALTCISSPHVVGVIAFGETPAPWLAMELVHGRTAKQIVEQEGPMSWERARNICAQVARGLAAVHEAGITHRDIKPSNVLVDDAGVAKLSDFGVAHLAAGDASSATALVGTPAYMAPEGNPDARSDIYSLGLLLQDMLAGLRPEASASLDATAEQRAPGRAAREAEPILEWMLQPLPQRRPTAIQVARALEGERPHRVWFAAAIAAVAVLVLGTGLTAWLATRGESPSQADEHVDSANLPTATSGPEIAAIVSEPSRTPTHGNLVPNGDFLVGFDRWTKQSQPGGCGPHGQTVLESGGVRFKREGSNGCGGTEAVIQELNLDVGDHSLVLEFEATVYNQNLCGGGTGDGKEAPAFVELAYRDTAGQVRYFWHGLSAAPICMGSRLTLVTLGERVTYELSLADVEPPIANLMNVTVGANGWDFQSVVHRVAIVER
ncbi:MAG: serine/threonine protein kinase [Dehalococcoidia bacterium]|nr:serine/threonine protein kinase [Dehalococcoidia bacterium]